MSSVEKKERKEKKLGGGERRLNHFSIGHAWVDLTMRLGLEERERNKFENLGQQWEMKGNAIFVCLEL